MVASLSNSRILRFLKVSATGNLLEYNERKMPVHFMKSSFTSAVFLTTEPYLFIMKMIDLAATAIDEAALSPGSAIRQ